MSEHQNRFGVEKVLKFGGSSVGTPERIQSVIEIVREAYASTPHIAVVVSAFGGTTDQLITLGKNAVQGKSDGQNILTDVIERHKTAANTLISQERLAEALKALEQTFSELRNVLEGIFLVKELSPKTLDLLMSFGERLSAFIIAEAILPHISQAKFLDARSYIKTDRSFGAARVDFNETNKNISHCYQEFPGVLPIMTGFIGSSKENDTTTLGRGGSDYTAAIVGAALNANVIEIWTDVNGVMTADPRKEPYAFSIPEMSYKEAMEMSYFGAKVIHPPTIIPALEKNIPLLIKNSFNPEAAGTLIGTSSSKSESLICGISSIDNAVLLCIQGSGMVGVCGIAKRLFGALAEKGINIILISQGSSEHSICVAVSPPVADLAKEAIEKEFALEIKSYIIDEVTIERNLSVIAVVGEKMCRTPGISGKLFGALGKNGINVIAITQGSSELNITVVVKKEDEIKAIRVVHEAFFLSPRKTLNVFLVGVGLIGRTLLEQIESHTQSLRNEYALDIRVIGLANSRKMAFNQLGVRLDEWNAVLDQAAEKMDINAFIERMLHLNLINSIFVDCTSDQAVSDAYEKILNASFSIVTPNKKANSGPYDNYKKLKEVTAKNGTKFLYGSNVGAGLPIISTINELVRSGDKILKIEAILSGTMSYLFNTFTEGKVFSDVVQEAQKKGYTEPDPRDDLIGMDVARKLLILARECNYPLEMDDIVVEKILPEDCFKASSIADFYERLKNHDSLLEAKRRDAQRENKVLRYIAKFENGQGSVSLQSVSPEHPFYHLSGNDNIIAIKSEFYQKNPLVIQGQGAGAEVTAGKVLADIVKLGLNNS
jgi:aspartokinase/homoserine dehydrogenase 1